MTSANGATAHTEEPPAVPDEAPQEAPQEPEAPRLEATSLEYWRQMTVRQVDRLQDRVDELEREATPLRQQINALKLALSATGTASRQPRVPEKHRGVEITELERELVHRLVAEGKDTTAIRERLPHVKSGQIYSVIYNARQKLARS